MCSIDGPSGRKNQAHKLACLGAELDNLDTANRLAFNAMEDATAALAEPVHLDDLWRAWDSTCRPLKVARRAYFTAARAAAARAIKLPKLPTEISAARAVVQAASDQSRAAGKFYAVLMELDLDLTSYRERSDAAADGERKCFIFEALRDSFNARIDRREAKRAEQEKNSAIMRELGLAY